MKDGVGDETVRGGAKHPLIRMCPNGATHFFGEAISTDLGRRARERQLIAEFNPIGNKTRGG